MKATTRLLKRKFLLPLMVLLLAVSPVISPAQPAQAATCTVTSSADSGEGSLRSLVADATCDTIDFAGDFDIRLYDQLPVDHTVTIDGAGHHVSLSGRAGVLSLNQESFSITLQNLTVKNSTCPIFNYGSTMTIANVVFSDNACSLGGAITNEDSAMMSISDSTFTRNGTSSGDGGAINNHFASLTVSGSTFVDNSSASDGGAIASWGDYSSNSITVVNSTFSGNSAVGSGGAIWTS